MTKRITTQTTTINGQRVRLVTTPGKVTVKAAPVLEWELQAAAVRALRSMPEYAKDHDHAAPGSFTLAGDFNAGRRSRQESIKAKATGLTAGEHDLRIYMSGGRLGLIEFKGDQTRVSADQHERHALLHALGFTHQAILRVASQQEAADAAIRQVRAWLAASNDNGTRTAHDTAA